MSGIKGSYRTSGRWRKSDGLTLVELMVAIGVTSIVATLSIGIFVSQLTHYERGKSVKQTQESGQRAIELLKTDLMQAGWSVSPDMAFYFEDGGQDGSDMMFINDARIVNLNVPVERRRMLLNDCPGGQPIMSGNNSSSPRIETVDIDGDGEADFKDNISEYVISNSTDTSFKTARITGVSGNQLSLDSAIGGTFLAPAVFYCADDGNNSDCHPSGSEENVLRRSDRELTGRIPMAENVIDMQVAYQVGVDWYGAAGCNGSGVGSGKCIYSPFDSKQITLIRVSVVTKGSAIQADRIDDSQYCRPAVENRLAAPTGSNECGYVYRTYTATVQPRNAGPLYR
ncbi:MAG: prepilin-type N-terminal cleavage/methylation domain-containing protein [Syntrophobacteraceae bacterium]